MSQSKLEESTVFSTCLIGDRAPSGSELHLFVTPVGQRMPQVPFDVTRCRECGQPSAPLLSSTDTNIKMAGQMGELIGDARFERIRAEFVSGGDPVVLEATVSLRIAGKRVFEGSLEKLLMGGLPLEDGDALGYVNQTRKTVPFVLVSRNDTVEAVLRLTREAKIVGDPLWVRVTLEGKFHEALAQLASAH